MAAFEALCRRQGLALTVQRRGIMEALAGRTDHPTADQLYADVAARLPGVSRTTVYRVLETLVRIGAARRASHLGTAARFDPNTERHHHMVCLVCDKVVDLDDLPITVSSLPVRRRAGFTIVDYAVDFRGTCPDCQRAAAPRPPRYKRSWSANRPA
jgi:Fur family peroxide stress response transcriptional regulator